jgi:hypothetical protein
MLAKLLSLLIHAKSGAISGVLLLGATGALVSVSAANGVTTITITEASPSPSASASASPNVSTNHTASPSPTASPSSPQLSSPASSQACVDEAKALSLQVDRVNTAFTGFHTDLAKLRGTRDTATLVTSGMTLKLVRESAVKAIHATATATCKKQDDADETDVDTDTDEVGNNDGDHKNGTDVEDKSAVAPATAMSIVDEVDSKQDNDGKGPKLSVTFTGTASAIADQAIAAMQVAFDAAKNAPVTTPKPERNSTNGSKVVPSKSPDHKGDHHD